MVAMRMENFGGMLPRLSRWLLPENMATYATNAHLKSGELRGMRAPFAIHTFSGSTTYKKAVRLPNGVSPGNPMWIGFRSPSADFFPSPLINDLYDRYIWLDDNGPGRPSYLMQNSMARMRAGDPPFKLGVEAATTAPTLSKTGGTGSVITTRAYLYTYANMVGEEGQPSAVSFIDGQVDATYTVADMVTPADFTTKGLTKKRVYRTVTGGGGTAFYYVGEVDITVTTYVDVRPDSDVAREGRILASETWAPPEMMEGIIPMPNGYFVGWRGKDVFFSEPYRPWAWPAAYTLAVEHPIIDAGVIDQTFVGITAVSPAMVTGTHPAYMSISKSTYTEPCISPDSIAQSPAGVFYASQNGLNLITASGLVPVSREAVLRTEWISSYVSGLRCAASFDGQYVAFTGASTGFVFTLGDDKQGIVHLVNYMNVDHIWTDPYTGDALLISSNTVYDWSSPKSAFLAADWVSKVFQFPQPVNLGALLVTLQPGSNEITDPGAGGIVDENTIPTGGPWLDQSGVINYQTINGPYIHEAPVWGSHPPGNGPPTKVWPFWYGVETGGNNVAIPGGPFCRVIVFANHVVVWASLIRSGVTYRLPSGFKSDMWQVQIQTRVPVMNVQLAETGKELARA